MSSCECTTIPDPSVKEEFLDLVQKAQCHIHELERFQELLKLCQTQQKQCKCKSCKGGSQSTRVELLLEVYLSNAEHHLEELRYDLQNIKSFGK
jgi:hypothetical protein